MLHFLPQFILNPSSTSASNLPVEENTGALLVQFAFIFIIAIAILFLALLSTKFLAKFIRKFFYKNKDAALNTSQKDEQDNKSCD